MVLSSSLGVHERNEMMERIWKLGLRLDRPNYTGNTPVHVLCSIGLDEPIERM